MSVEPSRVAGRFALLCRCGLPICYATVDRGWYDTFSSSGWVRDVDRRRVCPRCMASPMSCGCPENESMRFRSIAVIP